MEKDAKGKESNPEKRRGRIWIKPVILLLVIAALFLAAKFLRLGEKLGMLQDWIDALGAIGPVVFALVYILGTIFAVPGSALTVMAGALFGSLWGVILVSFASTTGASLCFLISRYIARGSVERWLGGNEKFKRLDELTGKHGGIIVAITRLVIIFPFNLLNYGFGLTKVKFSTYVFWSWLCMLPGTVVYVVGVDAIVKAMRGGSIPWPVVIIFVVAVLLMVFLSKIARKKLKESGETEIAAGETPDAPEIQET